MKKIILFVILILSLTLLATAQSVEVASKKTTYTRPKTDSEFKKTFTVNYPKVKAATPALSKKIEAALSYEKNLGFTLKEEIEGDVEWLEEADFEVKFNKNGVLCVSLFITGTGAYSTTSVKNVLVDSNKGQKVAPADVFTNIDGLLAEIGELQREEIKAGIEAIKTDADYAEVGDEVEEELKRADFTAANLDGFYLDERGVTFVYDYGFRHAIRALEPSGEYFMSWEELTPFIKPDGLLAGFVR